MEERFVFTSQPAPEKIKHVNADHRNPCKWARSFCDEPSMKQGDCDRCGGDKGCCRRAKVTKAVGTEAVEAEAVMIVSNLNC
ncbi:hypothetical protein ACOSQ3_027624 [Xanthoceras sorbifolium]